MKQQLDEALSQSIPEYHEFLIRYKNNASCIYGFVEGKEDPCYYRGAIDFFLPEEWRSELWPSGSKDRVVDIYKQFDWSRFDKRQVLFFVDRDLSLFLGFDVPSEINIYTTDKYSIENDVVSRDTCDRLLLEVFNMHSLPRDEKDKILDLFEKELVEFQKSMAIVMAWIIRWRMNGSRPCLNNIKIGHLFHVKEGKLHSNNIYQEFSTIEEYIHAKCSIAYDSSAVIDGVVKDFCAKGGQERFVRGKYLLWFLVAFLVNVSENISKFSVILTSQPKMHISFGPTNAVVVVSSRFRIPESLKIFLNATCCAYIKEKRMSIA